MKQSGKRRVHSKNKTKQNSFLPTNTVNTYDWKTIIKMGTHLNILP